MIFLANILNKLQYFFKNKKWVKKGSFKLNIMIRREPFSSTKIWKNSAFPLFKEE